MFRKILFIFVIFVLFAQNITFADEIDDEEINFDSIETSVGESEIPQINSKHVLVLERSTDTVLFEKDGYSKTAMASTTKIMTAIIALENTKMSDIVTISSKAANTGGSTLGISSNSKLTMQTLLYGLLMRSGNDCAVAIAEHISGNLPDFAKLMNQKAKDLGLKNTNFVTPHGLDATNHFTTAYDLALLTNYALKNEAFLNIVKNKTATINMNGYSRTVNNTHELLGYTEGVYGVKTGFTGNAGRCLVTSCKRNNLDIIVVVLGADTKKIRTEDSLKLINYIYHNFEMIDTYDFLHSNFEIKDLEIQNSFTKAKLYLEKKSNYEYPISKNVRNFKTKIYILNNQKAPLAQNSKIGTVQFFANDTFLYENNILVKEKIDSISFQEYFYYIIKILKNCFYSFSF